MANKTVLFALVALCCAAASDALCSIQAYAAPSEEKKLQSAWSCMKTFKETITLLKNMEHLYTESRAIFTSTKTAKSACSTAAAATVESIKACEKAASNAEMKAIIAELTKAAAEIKDIVENVEELKECL